MASVKLEHSGRVHFHNIFRIVEQMRYGLRFPLMLLLLRICLVLLAKDRGKIVEEKILFLPFTLPRLLSFQAFLALQIINPALLRITQHFVRVGDLLKLLFGAFGVLGVLVRVKQNRLLFEGFFYVFVRSARLEAHQLVEFLIIGLLLLLWLLLLSVGAIVVELG